LPKHHPARLTGQQVAALFAIKKISDRMSVEN
jgi:hypothetical protein